MQRRNLSQVMAEITCNESTFIERTVAAAEFRFESERVALSNGETYHVGDDTR